MKLVQRVIVALCLSVALAAPAAADRLSVLVGAHHAGAEPGQFRSSTPGLFYTWEAAAPWGVSLGLFANSYGGQSIAVTVSRDVAVWRGGAASLMAGVAHYPGDGRRQRYHLGDLVPMAGLQLRHNAVFVQVLPSDGRPVRAIVAYGLTVDLD